MPSFVVSELITQSKLYNINNLYSILSEKILLIPSYYKLDKISITRIDNNKRILELILKEPVEITFTKHNISFNSEIIIYTYMLPYNNKIIIIISPQGFGLTRKGGHLRQYVDLTIWQNCLRDILSTYVIEYRPITFSQEQLNFKKWGDELIEICINVPKFGKVTITYGGRGKKIQQSYKEFYEIYQKILSTGGKISKIKVKSYMIKKIIEIRDTGVIKINEKNLLKVVSYLINVLRDVI